MSNDVSMDNPQKTVVPYAEVHRICSYVVGKFKAGYPYLDAQVLYQEAWISIVQAAKRGQYDPEFGSVDSYMYGVARFAVLRVIRVSRQGITPHVISWSKAPAGSDDTDDPRHMLEDPTEHVFRSEAEDSVIAVLDKREFPVQSKHIKNYFMHGLSPEETAKIAGATVKEIKATIRSARRLLRKSSNLQDIAREYGITTNV